MHEIRGVLWAAARRLALIALLRALVVTFTIAVAGVLVLRIGEKLFGFVVPWQGVFVWGAVGAVVAAALWTIARRPREDHVARVVDERAGLRESLSTALVVEHEDDGWSKAVVESARTRAGSVRLREAVPIEAPRRWAVPVALAAATAAVWFALPNVDVLGAIEKRKQVEQERAQIREVRADIREDEKKIEALLNKAGVDPAEMLKQDLQTDEPQTAAELQRRQAVKLTSATEKLNELKQGEKAQRLDALRQQLNRLKQPGPGPMDKMSRALARGDFAEAKKQLDELSKQLAKGNLTPEQKAQLEAQLKNLAKQLEQRANDRKQLEDKLRKAGLSEDDAKKAAADPEALKKALEKLKGMSEEQKKELIKQGVSQMQACKNCQGMGQAMSKMAQSLSQGGQMGEGMGQLAGQLSELEQLAGEMAAVDESLAEAMAQLAQLGQCQGGSGLRGMLGGMGGKPEIGEWREGDNGGRGQGSGGGGRGFGPNVGAEESPFTLETKKTPTETTGQGPIIGSRFVHEMQVRGESSAEFSEAVEAGAQGAAEAIETMQVPREFQDPVKNYFGRMKKKVEGKPAEESSAESGKKPAEKPAEDDKDDGG